MEWGGHFLLLDHPVRLLNKMGVTKLRNTQIKKCDKGDAIIRCRKQEMLIEKYNVLK